MTRDEVVSLFHEAGETVGWKPGVGNPLVINYLTAFAALVAAAEREACAKVCDLRSEHFDSMSAAYDSQEDSDFKSRMWGAEACVEAIRARGQP